MTDKEKAWLDNRVLHLKGLKSRTEQQNILIELHDKKNRTALEDKKLSLIIAAEKSEEATKAKRLAASNFLQKEKNAEKEAAKARDTRKKILAGAFVLDASEKDDAAKSRLMNGLNKFLTRDDDRILFGLEPLPKSETQKNEQPKEPLQRLTEKNISD